MEIDGGVGLAAIGTEDSAMATTAAAVEKDVDVVKQLVEMKSVKWKAEDWNCNDGDDWGSTDSESSTDRKRTREDEEEIGGQEYTDRSRRPSAGLTPSNSKNHRTSVDASSASVARPSECSRWSYHQTQHRVRHLDDCVI